MKKPSWLQVVVGASLGGVGALVLLAVLTPGDRRDCARQAVEVCGEGLAATVEYSGMAGFSSCQMSCGDGPGPVRVVDRSWPFGEDR